MEVRPFEITLPRGHALGDWCGQRTDLERIGITPTFSLEVDVAGNPVGGRSQGGTEASNLGMSVAVDLERMAHWAGGSLDCQASQRWGRSLSADYVGNVFRAQQDYGGQTFHVIDVAYRQQLFDSRIEFRVGRIAAGDDFLVCQYDYLFMQNGFDGNPVGVFFDAPGMTAYPNATWGVLAQAHPTRPTYCMVGVYNGDPRIRHTDNNGLDLSLDGPAFVIGEAGVQVNGLPNEAGPIGSYKAGFWYDDSTRPRFGSNQSQRGSWGVYGLFDQVLIRFAGGQPNRGFGVFGSTIFSTDPSTAELPVFFTAGVVARGPVASRPADSIGLGVVYGRFSGDLPDAQERVQLLNPTASVKSHEVALEMTYRFSLRGNSTYLQPDLQYIVNPGRVGQVRRRARPRVPDRRQLLGRRPYLPKEPLQTRPHAAPPELNHLSGSGRRAAAGSAIPGGGQTGCQVAAATTCSSPIRFGSTERDRSRVDKSGEAMTW